jgi:hypothetical protein
LLGILLTTCGRPTPESDARPRLIDDPAELEQLDEAARVDRKPTQKKWKRPAPTPMPETFVAFELPELAALDGAWLVESEVPDRRVLWLIEEGGAKLTEVDQRGHERAYSMSIASPCALRLTDELGRTLTRSLAQNGEQLVISRTGATAVRGRDGSMLACIGHRTYQIAPDGRCRFTSEMLGTWSEPATPDDRCELGKDERGPVLTIGEQRLHEQDGLWLGDGSTRAVAVADRAAGLAALASDGSAPTPPSEP